MKTWRDLYTLTGLILARIKFRGFHGFWRFAQNMAKNKGKWSKLQRIR